MIVRFPNRVGERGIYGDSAVTLTGSASRGMQSCATAVSTGALADGDMVGVSLVSVADPNRWAVWTAIYSGTTGSLALETVESVSATPISAGSAVDVTLCVTTQTLDWYVNGVPSPAYFDGPDYWSADENVTWNAVDAAYDLTGGSSGVTLTPTGTWADGLRPTQMALEIFVPSDANAGDAEYTDAIVMAGSESNAMIGAGVQLGAWNAVTVPMSASDDISWLSVSAGDFYAAGGFRFRFITFT